MIIAVDGPAASGKGTLARRLAGKYNLAYLDTGSLYRAVAYEVLHQGKDPKNEDTAVEVAKALDLSNIEDDVLRTAEVGAAASIVAAMSGVREAIREFQRQFAATPPSGQAGAVLDGRDIGTVICPDADVKLFVDASAEIRAKRRFLELQERGAADGITEEALLADLKERDTRDRTRADSPLKPAENAHLLDTSNLSIEAAFQAACAIVDRALEAKNKTAP